MAGWNFADLYEAVAGTVADRPAIVAGRRRLTWAEFDGLADAVGGVLLEAGLRRQDKVALYLHNCPEYLVAQLAAFKVAMVPVNTNYRYRDAELRHVWEDSAAAAVVFHGEFSERIERLRGEMATVRLWLWVDDGAGPCPEWARPFPPAGAGRSEPPWARSGDDLVLRYTGGTTGLPKGVMWRQDDVVRMVMRGSGLRERFRDLKDLRDRVSTGEVRPRVGLPACPLMHGTGAVTADQVLHVGGTVVLLPAGSFDPVEFWEAVQDEQVNHAGIVGDAFARPMLAALDAHPSRWELGSLRTIFSAGVMFSEPVKQGLLGHLPWLLLIDALGSSEAPGLGVRASGADSGLGITGVFELGETARVLAADGRRDVVPGSGETGMLAVSGLLPVGYHNDPARTAEVFREIEGVRYALPGDYATVDADGSVRLIGRGSECINTGGEKVFPEEVEEILKAHPGVSDAVVVGVPDERFGEAVAAFVAICSPVSHAELITHVKERLAGYKAPRYIVTSADLGARTPAKPTTRRCAAGRCANSGSRRRRRWCDVGVRMAEGEAWEFLERGHTGIFTSVRADGWPVSLPVWYVIADRRVYLHTPAHTSKVSRVRRDDRACFVVESGERWVELAAVVLRVRGAVLAGGDEAEQATALFEEKYAGFRPQAAALPSATQRHYDGFVVIRLEPDGPPLTWDNSRLRLREERTCT